MIQSWIFSIITLQCHMILQKSFWYSDLLHKKTVVLLPETDAFFQDSLSSKEQHLFKTEIFRNIINGLTLIFDQFIASSLNKNIHFFQKHITDPKLFSSSVCLLKIHYVQIWSNAVDLAGGRRILIYSIRRVHDVNKIPMTPKTTLQIQHRCPQKEQLQTTSLKYLNSFHKPFFIVKCQNSFSSPS